MQIECKHFLLTSQRRSKDRENNSPYLCLFLIIQFLSRLCNIYFSIALKKCYLMMKFEKKFILLFSKYPLKCKFDDQTLINSDFLEGRLPKYFFRKYVPLVASKLYAKFQQL